MLLVLKQFLPNLLRLSRYRRYRPDSKCGSQVPPLPDGEAGELECRGRERRRGKDHSVTVYDSLLDPPPHSLFKMTEVGFLIKNWRFYESCWIVANWRTVILEQSFYNLFVCPQIGFHKPAHLIKKLGVVILWNRITNRIDFVIVIVLTFCDAPKTIISLVV